MTRKEFRRKEIKEDNKSNGSIRMSSYLNKDKAERLMQVARSSRQAGTTMGREKPSAFTQAVFNVRKYSNEHEDRHSTANASQFNTSSISIQPEQRVPKSYIFTTSGDTVASQVNTKRYLNVLCQEKIQGYNDSRSNFDLTKYFQDASFYKINNGKETYQSIKNMTNRIMKI